jgi:hypothetical protein
VQQVAARTHAETIDNLQYLDEDTRHKIRVGVRVQHSTHVQELDGVLPGVPVLTAVPVPQDVPLLPREDLQYLITGVPVVYARKRGRGKSENLTQYRIDYRATKLLIDRVQILHDIDSYLDRQYMNKTGDLTETARTFYQKNVVKVVNCVSTCHAGNIQAYTSMMSTILGNNLFVAARYRCKCGTVTETGP